MLLPSRHPALLIACLIALLPGLCHSQSVAPVPTPVSSISHRGASLQVMEYGTLRFVEPFIAVRPDTCLPGVGFDHLAGRYSLRVPLMLDTAGLPGAAMFAPTQLEPTLRGAVNGTEVGVDCSLDQRAGEATLAMWCDSFNRCQQLRWAIVSSHASLADSLMLTVRGVLGRGESVTLSGRQLRVLPRPSPPSVCGTGWVLFQQRVDGSLSFQQNWDTYLRGFGHPDSNYWMGLERISAETLTSLGRAQCMLRIEVVDVSGTAYFAETTTFQVLGAANTYSFYSPPTTISAGSLYSNIFYYHNNMTFLTYDKDSASYCSGGCSKNYGHSGWWYASTFRFNLNGVYTDKSISSSQDGYNQAMIYSGTLVDMRTTKMFYKCL